MAGIINNALNVNIGASPEELLPDWFGVTIWGGSLKDVLEKEGKIGELPVYKSKQFGGRLINFDVTDGLPFTSASVENIYTSHFIEHINFTEGKEFIGECYRVLKPGGILRIICPDIDIWIDKLYNQDDSKFFEGYKKALNVDTWENELYREYDNITTPIELFNSMIFNWGHRWMWNFKSIQDLLNFHGFERVRKLALGEGDLFQLSTIENSLGEHKVKLRDLESLYVEAVKPEYD